MSQGKNRRQSGFAPIVGLVLIVAIASIIALVLIYIFKDQKAVSTFRYEPFGGKSDVFILLMGVDQGEGNYRSDTMILAKLDLQNKSISGLSLPRDSRVSIAGTHAMDKINSAITRGGPVMACETVKQFTGIPVDYYVRVRVDGFQKLVDIIGGVDIDVDRNMHYTDRAQKLYINLRKGYQHLDGNHAMQYVRFRHDVMGDITRVGRQQVFVKAVLKKIIEPKNIVKLPKVADEIKKNVDTNIPVQDIAYIAKVSKDIKPENIKMETVPGVPENINGISYWIPDDVKMQEVIQKLFYNQPAGTESVNASAGEEVAPPEIAVLNGSGKVGIATSIAKDLSDNGYKVSYTGNAKNFNYDETLIVASPAYDKVADELIKHLGFGIKRTSDTSQKGNGISIIIGKDYTF